MKIKVITKMYRFLNVISNICLLFGVLSIIWTATVASEIWAAITVGIIFLGTVSIVLNLIISKHLYIDIFQIEKLNINSLLTLNKIESEDDIEYLGNWFYLKNGTKFEAHRNATFELISKLNENRIEIIEEKEFWSISPKELIKGLLRFF